MKEMKFNFPEIFLDSNGKTSPSLVCGVLGCVTALCGIMMAGNVILYMVIWEAEKNADVINFMNALVMQCIALFGLAGSMITAHRLSKDKKDE